MKLRWKFFLILLLASLIPLVTATGISQKASGKLGTLISANARQTLAETVVREIVFATENYARITHMAKSALELALRVLASEAEQALSSPPPRPPPLYFDSDFDSETSGPRDLAPSSIHFTIANNGNRFSKPVSYEHPNFLIAPGVERKDVEADIARLSRLIPTLKNLSQRFDDRIFWIYASSESGVHISYPGHGGYPDDYDPRIRPWYKQAKDSGEMNWGPPIVDITTRQLTFTVSAPFYNADRSLAGVAAIDILLPHVLLKREISAQWSNNMKAFLVGMENAGSEKQKVWVMSQNDPSLAATGPQAGLDGAELNELLRHRKMKKSGHIDMPYHGTASLWAYATIFQDLYFVIVVPKSVAMGLPENIATMFSNYTYGQTAISVTVVVLAVFFVAFIAFFASRTSTRQVMKMVNAFRRLAQGDFSVRLNLRLKDERDLMINTFNEIVPKLEEHLRMSTALGVAQEVQQSLLPKNDPVLHGFDIAGSSIYCEETGGDYYDFIDLDPDRLAVVVGDVSGHGVSSALLMATARALIMLRASMPGPAAGIINDVNRQLSLDSYYTGNFMTFFYCELSSRKQEAHWVRAGHDPALLYDPSTGRFAELKGHGLALGIDDTFEYDTFSRILKPGQMILIGTDGIWEMCNQEGKFFGKERLKEVIRTHHSASSRDMIMAVTEALNLFRGARQPEDDITMVVIKVL